MNTEKNYAKQRAKRWIRNNALVLDTETTGLDNDAEIVEIAVIDCTGKVLINTLVKPNKPIPVQATAIHGITNHMVKDAPAWPDVEKMLCQTVAGREVVIYNADFDLRLIQQTNERNGLRAISVDLRVISADLSHGPVSCAMRNYAQFWGEWDDCRFTFKWQKLTEAAKQQNIKIDGKAHRALADCKTTLELIKVMAR